MPQEKLKLRMKHFMMDAEGAIFISIIVAAIIAEISILNEFSKLLGPFCRGWLGLPKKLVFPYCWG